MEIIPKSLIDKAERAKEAINKGEILVIIGSRRWGGKVVQQLLQTEDIKHEEIMENIVKRKLTVTEILDAMPYFRDWIKETKLYNVIQEETNPSSRFFRSVPTIVADDIVFQLNEGVVVRTPYDLPIELIYSFYQNSPFLGFNLDQEIEDRYLPPQKLIKDDDNNK